jgi:hypothetical protein
MLPYRAMRAWTGPLLVLALLTGVLTWPLAPRAAGVGPINTGDGQWSIWSTCWAARTLVADPLHLYDANVFSPRRGTLAYSETNIVSGALAIPAWWATKNPYLAYNTAILLAFFLASIGTFALARHVAGEALPALFAAIAFAFAPLVIVRLAHVQLLMTFGLPVAVLAMHRFIERRSVLRGIALAAALVLAALGTGYYGIAAALAVGLGFVYYGATRGLWRRPGYLAACAGVVLLAGLFVLPFFLPYLRLEQGGTAFRSIDETRRYSADWRSYLTSTAHVQRWLLGWLVPFDTSAFPERVLFPGFVVCALAALSVCGIRLSASASENAGRLRRTRRSLGEGGQPDADTRDLRLSASRETVGFYALLGVVGAWLSFGPAAGLYWLFYRFVPGFSLTRAPARLGILVVLSLAVLASIGLARLAARARRPAPAAALACVLLVAELAAVPLDLRTALAIPAPNRALASQPAGAVGEFPYFYLERDLYRNSLYMLYSTAHWHPLVNGYSDFIPDDYRQTVVAISTFPSREAFRLLRERGARYAIVHLNLYDRRSREKLLDAIERYKDYLRPLTKEGDVCLFEIVAWPQ